jgi:hypothetical protein
MAKVPTKTGRPISWDTSQIGSLVREQYIKAQEYRDKIQANGDPEKLPAPDLRMEAWRKWMASAWSLTHSSA